MKNQRVIRVILGIFILAAALMIPSANPYIKLALYLGAYFTVGGDVLWKALGNIVRGQVFDENFLMGLATVGALLLGEYPEAVAVMLFYQIGEYFQDRAIDQSRRSIAGLMDLRPDFVHVRREGELVDEDPYDVQVGDLMVIKAGEKVPLDGRVLEGSSQLDTSALTGEPIPREVMVGSEILSGCINMNGMLTVEVSKPFEESTVSKILDLVENATDKKSKSENFITRFAAWYTPIVVVVAIILALVPPLLIADAQFKDWVYRALIFLVISCPCALVISVPLSFFGGIGNASKKGILVKGSNYLEALSRVEIAVFDKTGTLTKGVFAVQSIKPVGITEDELIELAAYAESYSNHPISISLREAYGREIDQSLIGEVEEFSGQGVCAQVRDKRVAAGNIKLMDRLGMACESVEADGTIIYVAVDETYAGYIVIADEIKADAARAIRELKAVNVHTTVMLTGDLKPVGERVAEALGLDRVYTELLPDGKVEQLEALLDEKSERGTLIFVGDGINDAPVLARADIGIAMGGLGSDAAIEAADVVIMTDEPSKLAVAIGISQQTLRIARQNIVFALTVKAVVLALGAAGLATMWAAIFADVGVAIIAILNAVRMLRY